MKQALVKDEETKARKTVAKKKMRETRRPHTRNRQETKCETNRFQRQAEGWTETEGTIASRLFGNKKQITNTEETQQTTMKPNVQLKAQRQSTNRGDDICRVLAMSILLLVSLHEEASQSDQEKKAHCASDCTTFGEKRRNGLRKAKASSKS